jgi:hypothetical protein
LIAFGLGLRDRGWRITFLGPDTPLETLTDAVTALQPEAVVLAATTPAHFESGRDALRRLARALPLDAAGSRSDARLRHGHRARVLDVDPLAAAEHVATARRA